jgi:predicted NodU family carbamoyl transferase
LVRGRERVGPRALGGRSIIASPTRPGIRSASTRDQFREVQTAGHQRHREGLAQLVACDTVPASLALYMRPLDR